MTMSAPMAHAATIVLDPGPGTDYLSIWCGGQSVNEIATGFDAAGNALTQVRVATTCNGSGRGSRSQHYLACWAVTFGEDGTLLSKVWEATNHWVQGSAAIPCPAPADPAAIYTFADGAGNYPATLSTGLVGATSNVYRGVLETTCAPIHFGETVSGTIGTPGQTDCYFFSGPAGDSVRVATVDTSSTLQVGQQVLGPDGTVLCGTSSGSVDCTLNASGRHIILVNDYTGAGTGGYDLSLSCLSPWCLPFDYTLGSSGAITVAPGASGTETINATLASGVAESVSFSVSGLPEGVTATFDVGACAPTCTSHMTILVAGSTSDGVYPITVTGSPLGRSIMFTLTAPSRATGPCPAVTALATSPNQTSMVGVLHDVRDRALSRTPTGRQLVRLYYKDAAEAVELMMHHPDLRTRSLALIEHFLPSLQAAAAGQPVTLSTSEAASIDSLLEAFATDASPGFRSDVNAVRQGLKQGAALKALGVSVR